jgi:malonate transporter and related proteins
MLTILNSLFPVFAVIMFGYAAKHYKFLNEGFWPNCEKLAYYILLPLLLFTSISTAPYDNIEHFLTMVSVSIGTISVIAAGLFLIKYLFRIPTSNFISLFQGSIYANAAYIGIPAASALFGKEGLSAYALLMAATVPFVNAVTIITLSCYAHEQGSILRTVIKKVSLHPIILACLGGFALNYNHIVLPTILTNTLDILGKAAVPMGLIIVGGALDIKALKGTWSYIGSSTFIKLLVSPAIAIVLAKEFGITGLQAHILILYATLPTAAATYLLAKKMKGNAPMMASIIVFETLLAFVTMTVVMGIAGTLFPLG